MDIPVRFDSKGKYYTKIVSTTPLHVLIRLHSGELVHGSVHLRPGARLSDELNQLERFLSVTDAVVYRDARVLYESAFIALAHTAIEWVIPEDAVGKLEAEGEETDR